MGSLNFNLRGISPQLMEMLKKEAKVNHLSVNLLILKFIKQGIGHTPKGKRKVYHDLDSLANTWSEQEAQAFEQNIKFFETIDEEH